MPDDDQISEDSESDQPLYSLDDVCDRLDNIEQAIKENHRGIGPLVGALFVFLVLIYLIPDLWHSKVRYALWYGISSDEVVIEKRPADCDFLQAPIGAKGCEYKRQMNSVLVRTDTSDLARGPVNYVSYDNGKTWNVDNSVPPTKPQITISWDKVEE